MILPDLLPMITELDLGPRPVINGRIVNENEDIEWRHHIRLRKTKKEEKECWAIVEGPFVLNKEGNWEYTPMPSERREDFCEQTRFDTIEEAIEFYSNWKKIAISRLPD